MGLRNFQIHGNWVERIFILTVYIAARYLILCHHLKFSGLIPSIRAECANTATAIDAKSNIDYIWSDLFCTCLQRAWVWIGGGIIESFAFIISYNSLRWKLNNVSFYELRNFRNV